jgi:ABC-type hemin transport system ATPase subunit
MSCSYQKRVPNNHRLERWLIKNINRNAETTLAIAKKLVFPFCLYEVCRTGKMQARTLLSQKKLHYNALLQREMNWWAQKYILKVKGQETTSIN